MEPIKPPPAYTVAQIAIRLLAGLVIVGMLTAAAILLRCVFWFIEACSRDFGIQIHEWFLEVVVVLIALLSRPSEPPGEK